jgi:hypothetical protein
VGGSNDPIALQPPERDGFPGAAGPVAWA